MRLLYLSCHEVLEFDEISLFHELGIEVFSTGAHRTPAQSSARLRPALPRSPSDSGDTAAFQALSRAEHGPVLTREFVDRFDAVLVMHMPCWIVQHWEAMRHKPVIWRTIGQSTPGDELTIQSYRGDGLHIVRYSPAERRLPYYAGEDAVIRFYKDPAEWTGWTGERPVGVCFSQFMPRRPLHCNYHTFRHVTRDLPCELYGPDNEDAGPLWRGCLAYDQLRSVLRTGRACFHTGTFPASYTLGFIEAWMTGIPVVAVGPRLFGQAGPELSGLYELPELIEHEVNGFVSDDLDELRSCLQCLLAHQDYAREVSQAGRAAALRYFDKAAARGQWRDFFAALPISRGGSPGIDGKPEKFIACDSWFERKFRAPCGARWPTLKAALKLWLQAGGKTIVETGCTHQANNFGLGCSTVLFSEVAARYGGRMWSVDNNPRHVATALDLTVAHAAHRRCIAADSVEFLQRRLAEQPDFSGRIDLLYLDSLDYPLAELMARFGCATVDELRFLLADTADDDFAADHADLIDPPQRHCLAELQAALPLLHPRSVVLIDDNSLPGGGKPRLAKRLLAEFGWHCVLDAYQTLWLHPGWRGSSTS